MANHKSTKKRIKSTEVRRLRNKYYHKSARTAIKKLRDMEDKKEAESFLPKVVSTIDKMVKRNIFHKNKAANLKSSLTLKVKGL
jgi:small subunit ribosomal protein S20